MKMWVRFFSIILFFNAFTIYGQEDSLYINDEILTEIEIVAFSNEERLPETNGSISFIGENILKSNSQSSLFNPLNTLPGVQFEERSPGSYRINIRGSSIRSPFDVRNVKIYLNDIPLTEPGGNTPLNIIDPTFLQSITVMRGPSSSKYGVGTGGVVTMSSISKRPIQKPHRARFSYGSFQNSNIDISTRIDSKKSYHQISGSLQNSQGYRNHSELSRKFFNYSGVFSDNSDRKTTANLIFSDLFYEIPGGLNRELFDEDPTLSRPGNPFVMGTEESNSSINTQNIILGLTHERTFNNGFYGKATLFGKGGLFDNPFIFDYKKERTTEYGIKTELSYDDEKFSAGIGGEYQYRFANASNFGNNLGEIDTLNFKDLITSTSGLLFAHMKYRITDIFNITGGIGLNTLQYSVNRTEDNVNNNPGLIETNFMPFFAPRIGLSWEFLENIYLQSSYAMGFSPPTLEEVRTNEGSVNTDLQPETGKNFEIGVKGKVAEDQIYFEAVSFFYNLENTIVDYVSERGTDLFRNSGNTVQNGFETSLGYLYYPKDYFNINLDVSYTYNDFIFGDYITGQEDFSGFFMPGIAPHTISFSSNIRYKNFSFNISNLFKDEIFLENDNSVSSPAFNLLNLGANYLFPIFDRLDIDIFLSVNNLLDQKYSLGNDVNAFGARYFQPAPPRNYQLGCTIAID